MTEKNCDDKKSVQTVQYEIHYRPPVESDDPHWRPRIDNEVIVFLRDDYLAIASYCGETSHYRGGETWRRNSGLGLSEDEIVAWTDFPYLPRETIEVLPACPLCGAKPEIVTVDSGVFVQCSDSLAHEHSQRDRYMSDICSTESEAKTNWIQKNSGSKLPDSKNLTRELGSAAEEKARADAWRERAEAAEARLAKIDTTCVWTPLHFGGIIVGCTSLPWDIDMPEVCPHCRRPVSIGELSY